MTVSKHAIQSMIREKRYGAKSLEQIRENTDKLLITILIGNNVVNVASSSLATITTLKMVESLNLPESYGLMLATGVVTTILLFFGEITPKTFCTRYNESVALFVAPIYKVLMFILTPISFIVELFLKIFNLF